MKKKVVIIILILILILLSIGSFFLLNHNEKTFYLEDNYYGKKQITEINFDELEELIKKKESFAVFIYQPLCVTSSDFESILNEFVNDKKIIIYKIKFSDIKDTNLGNLIEYYPSFAIFNKGKLIDYLEADKDSDVDYYTSMSGFENWFNKYVKFKEINDNDLEVTEEAKNENNHLDYEVNLDNVTRDKNKVNIYFFWGDGCPHCEEEKELFESIEKEYGKYYNLYTFETWHDEDNNKLAQVFAEAMGEEITGVPYTIIGNKSFKGYGSSLESEFIKTIKEQSKNNYDVYFDVIKKTS